MSTRISAGVDDIFVSVLFITMVPIVCKITNVCFVICPISAGQLHTGAILAKILFR